MAVVFPLPADVVKQLGGAERIAERLQAVEPSKLMVSGAVSREHIDGLVALYSALLEQLEVVASTEQTEA